MFQVSLISVVTSLGCSLLAGQDAASPGFGWPQFLGPNRDGVTAETGWSPDGAEEPLWTKNVGLGYSCPSIIGGRLVTMGYEPDAELDTVLCLDKQSGAELWRHSYPATDQPQYHGGGTLTTPSIAGGTVYTLNRHGQALALDVESGAVIWKRDYRQELELEPTFHGYCASPVVVADKIVYVLGGTAVVAKRDGGEVVWRTDDKGDGAYTNPTVFELGGRTLVAVMLAQVFYVLELETGEVAYELSWPLQGSAVHVAQPLVIGDRVILSSAYGKGAAMLRLGEAREPEVLWTSRKMRNKVTGLLLHGEHVYGFDESMLKCFDLSGDEAWRVRGLGMGALSIVGGRLLVLSSSGELIIIEATPEEYRELSRRQVLEGGSYWTMPVLVDGLVYVRNSLGDMACLDHRLGTNPVASATTDSRSDPRAAPTAVELFEGHAAASGGATLRKALELRLAGAWEILGRGMARTPMTLTLQAPNRWRLGLDSGDLVQTFDGELGWEVKNGEVRLFDDAEREEAPWVLALADLLAPSCPSAASVESRPVPFGGVACWRVVSTRPAARSSVSPAGQAPLPEPEPLSVAHYFDVRTGRLVGRDGEGLATTILHGALPVGDVRLPARIVIYRSGSGQEEALYLTSAEWAGSEPTAFEHPPGLARLLRTPAQLAADTLALRARYAKEVGRYRVDIDFMPDDLMLIHVDNGELWSSVGNDPRRLNRMAEDDPTFAIAGARGATLAFEYESDGSTRGIRLHLGPESYFLPRLE